MLGNAMFRVFLANSSADTVGTARGEDARRRFSEAASKQLITGVDVENQDSLVRALIHVRPNVVVNCVGLVKQLAEADDPLRALPINSLLPHRLAMLCQAVGARLVHFSTDCVFSGAKGYYSETDAPDALDLYGRSKLLGEVRYPNAITLRTSIIGHELVGSKSLIGWFLSAPSPVQGFTRAVFSGLPTVELSRVVHDIVLPRTDLHGVYHVAAKPINKFDLLHLVAEAYGKQVYIVKSDSLVIDRSLCAEKFRQATGYVAPDWRELVKRMRDFG